MRQRLAAASALASAAGIQGAAFWASDVHGAGKEVSEESAHTQNNDGERGVEERVAHLASAARPARTA